MDICPHSFELMASVMNVKYYISNNVSVVIFTEEAPQKLYVLVPEDTPHQLSFWVSTLDSQFQVWFNNNDRQN